MNFAQKIAYNTLVQVAGKGITLVIGLITLNIFTGFLGAENYGYYSIATTFLGLFVVIADMGLSLIAVRELSMSKKPGTLLQEILGFRVSTGLAVLALAPLIALFIPSYPLMVKIAIALLAFAYFFNTVNQLGVSFFQARLKMDIPTGTEVLGKIVTLAAIYYLSLNVSEHPSLLLVIAAVILGSLINLVATFLFVKRAKQSIKPLWNSATYRRLMQDSLALTAITILGTIHMRADALILSFYHPATDVGLYALAYKVLEIILAFPAIFIGIIFPALTHLLGDNQDKEAGRLYDKSLRLLIIGSVVLMFFFVLYAPEIVSVVQGQAGFEDSAIPLRILSLTLPALFIGSLVRTVLIALYRQTALIWQLGLVTLINVVLNFMFVAQYSYVAAAWIMVLTEVLITILPIFLLKDRFSIAQMTKTILHGTITTVVFGVILYALWRVLPIDIPQIVATSSKLVGYIVLGSVGAVLMALFGLVSFATRFIQPSDFTQLYNSRPKDTP